MNCDCTLVGDGSNLVDAVVAISVVVEDVVALIDDEVANPVLLLTVLQLCPGRVAIQIPKIARTTTATTARITNIVLRVPEDGGAATGISWRNG